MQQLHTDNHYVPEVYLKQWAPNGMVPTFRLLVSHPNVPLWSPHSLKGIAVHRHLYTRIVGGTENDDLERWLDSEFEAPAERAITLAVTDQRLTRDDWKKLVRFAIAQDVRTPAYLREFMKRQAQQMPLMLDKVIPDAVEKLRQNKLSGRRETTTSSSGFPLKISTEAQEDGEVILRTETIVGRTMWHLSLRHLLTDTIQNMPYEGWSILRAAPGCSWPTSDNPLIRLNYIDDERYDFRGGWAVPNGEVLLPLSPTHLLHRCAGRRPFPRRHRLDLATSEKYRRFIIEHADRYVFAKEEFDLRQVRARTVNLELYKAEQGVLANWHVEQTNAETG